MKDEKEIQEAAKEMSEMFKRGSAASIDIMRAVVTAGLDPMSKETFTGLLIMAYGVGTTAVGMNAEDFSVLAQLLAQAIEKIQAEVTPEVHAQAMEEAKRMAKEMGITGAEGAEKVH